MLTALFICGHVLSKQQCFLQEAEKYFESERSHASSIQYDWSEVYTGACAVMWQSTGEQR